MSSPPVSCSECGAPLPATLDPLAALSEEELAALPPNLLSRARVLCPSCATPSPAVPDSDTSQHPMSEGTRYFRLVFSLHEAKTRTPIPDSDTDQWENVGGFILRGHGQSVAAFMEEQANEIGKRMQVILDFADEG